MIIDAYYLLIISLMFIVIILQHHKILNYKWTIRQFEKQGSKTWEEVRNVRMQKTS